MDNWRELIDLDDLTDMDKIPEQLWPILSLYRWSSTNTFSDESSYSPFSLFLDLSGWTLDNFGELMFRPDKDRMHFGYLETDLIGEALTCYAKRPHDVEQYVNAVLEAELNG